MAQNYLLIFNRLLEFFKDYKSVLENYIENISKNRKQLLSTKLLQKQKKEYQLEYRAILKTLSVMLVAVRQGQLLGKHTIIS